MVTDNAVVTTTDYAGSYIYENSSLKFFNQAEGYIEPDGVGGYDYVYQYKDHLGNIRLSYSDSNGDGVVDGSEILQEKNYYPFGLLHKGYNNLVNGQQNRFLTYNGVEFEESFDLNLYEMDLRQYDPAIARWTSLDPVIHYDYSPYEAFDNNPVFWADPSGADSIYNFETGQYVINGQVVSQDEAIAYAQNGGNADGSNNNTPNDSESNESPDDTYKVGKNGKIRKVDDKKYYDKDGNEVDKLISEKTGKSKLVDRGILNHVDTDESNSGTNYQYFYLPNSQKSTILFNWLAYNTDVEFSLLTYSNHAYISTSFSYDSEAGGADILYDTVTEGVYTRFNFTHSHPRGSSPLPSGYSISHNKSNDKKLAQYYQKNFPNIKINWSIRPVGRTSNIRYNYKKVLD